MSITNIKFSKTQSKCIIANKNKILALNHNSYEIYLKLIFFLISKCLSCFQNIKTDNRKISMMFFISEVSVYSKWKTRQHY